MSQSNIKTKVEGQKGGTNRARHWKPQKAVTSRTQLENKP